MAKTMKAAIVRQLGKPLSIEEMAEGKVRAHIHKSPLSDINKVFADLKAGKVDGRIVIDL